MVCVGGDMVGLEIEDEVGKVGEGSGSGINGKGGLIKRVTDRGDR